MSPDLSPSHVALALLLAAAGCHGGRTARAPQAGAKTLSVMTYNVNYGIPGDSAALSAIAKQDSDLVLLQETTPEWEASIRAQLAERFPHMAFRHCCGAGGMAVLSKHPFEDEGTLPPPEGGWFPAWHVTVHGPLGDVQILNVHLRPQLSQGGSFVSGYFTTPGVREREIERYVSELSPDVPTIIAGDFNENRTGLAIRYLERRGFRSALQDFEGSSATWRWNTSIGPVTSELDHVVYDPHLEPLSVRVVQAGNSDHLPVVAVFELTDGQLTPSCSGSAC